MAGVVSGLEPYVERVLTLAGKKLFGRAKNRWMSGRVRGDARTLVPPRVAERLLDELNEAQAHRLYAYVSSPDFEEVALQYMLGQFLNDVPEADLHVNIRHEIRLGLRHAVDLPAELATTTADVLFDALTIGFHFKEGTVLEVTPAMVGVAAHLTAAAAANCQLLRGLSDLAEVHEFASQLRAQVVAMHRHMRQPHLRANQSVPYDQLYIPPALLPEHTRQETPDLTTLALSGQRSVILGDPGAGKSTLAAKLAHDVAADQVPGAEGRVPFLLVLRDFTGSFREGGKRLAHYLEQVCRDPYNLEPPADAVEYLLRNGRAVVLLDGLDELREPALRRKVVQLVDGFVNRYPLVPVLVTARRVGYSDAPLDRTSFTVGMVAELTDAQVREYAERWFALDESIIAPKRSRMARSFVAESRGIAELRRNPLLLSLLCAMYATEHYIPTNLAQVYERCAEMLFDQWDVQRGLTESPQFHGRLRTAVQYLAWHLFDAEESGKALPRRRIVRVLAEHFTAKGFPEDDAISTAEQFVAFCTGRAWVLSDVGATEIEPRYGFTHRTFMEYFAAEHLARANPTPDQLWEAVRPQVIVSNWDVTTRIALQLLDRAVDGGADALLRLVLTESPQNDLQQIDLYGFAADALGYVHPSYDTVRDVTAAAVHMTLRLALSRRHHYWFDIDVSDTAALQDMALRMLLSTCSPGNLLAVRRALTALLGARISEHDDGVANLLLLMLPTFSPAWLDVKHEVEAQHTAAITAWRARTPWAQLESGVELHHVVRQFGAEPLYGAHELLSTESAPAVDRVLRAAPVGGDPLEYRTELCASLVAAPRPWISGKRWWTQVKARGHRWRSEFDDRARSVAWKEAPIAPLTLLLLPYLETYIRLSFKNELLPDAPVIHQLHKARVKGEVHPNLAKMLTSPSFPNNVAAFLASWVRREFDVVCDDPSVSSRVDRRR